MNGSRVTRIATDREDVLAFALEGSIESEDMAALARTIDDAFESHDKINLLLILSEFGLQEALSSLNADVLKAQLKSPTNVARYAVVGAPAVAEAMIRLFNPLIPVEARAFEPAKETEAWRFVGARRLV